MGTVRIAVALIVCTFMIAGLTGCQRAAESVIERATGVSVDEDGESITLSTGDEEVMLSTGDSATLPSDWPSDMPVYDDATIENSSSLTSGEERFLSVTLSTSDSFDQVWSWHADALPSDGWTVENEFVMEQNGQQSGSYYLKKGEREATVWINEDEEGGAIIGMQLQQ